MSMKDSEVNKFLREVQSHWRGDARKKGTPGEKAALAALKRYKNLCRPSVIVHSYKYPYVTGAGGNIHLYGKNFSFDTTSASDDEIDLVYLTQRRIFILEVKTYKRDKIKLTDEWEYNKGTPVDKSVQSQTEKHCRQFYQTFWEYIPEGKPAYIVPVIVFVDKCHVFDKRSMKQKEYIPACTINNLNKVISVLDTPLKYGVDIDKLLEVMINKQTSNEGILR